MRRAPAKAAAAGILAALTVGLSMPAVAGDHRPPRATLQIADDVQRGRIYHADGWTRPTRDGKGCIVTFAHGFPRFGKALKHSDGEEIVVRLDRGDPPLEVEVQRWPRVNSDGEPEGTPTPVPFVLRPAGTGESQAWEISILPPVVDGHLFLGVGAYWQNNGPCGSQPDLGSQYAAWTFHARS